MKCLRPSYEISYGPKMFIFWKVTSLNPKIERVTLTLTISNFQVFIVNEYNSNQS